MCHFRTTLTTKPSTCTLAYSHPTNQCSTSFLSHNTAHTSHKSTCMVIPDSLCTAHSTTLHMYTRQPTYAMFGSNKSLQHNSHSNMEYRPSTASVPPHHLHIQDRSYLLCSVMFNEIAATHNIPHSTAFHMQVTNTRHSCQNGTRCRDGVSLLWCQSYLVFEGSIPMCACFCSENFFLTCCIQQTIISSLSQSAPSHWGLKTK